MKSKSFVKMQKSKILELCEETISCIKIKRKEKERDYVLAEIERRDSWFRRLLGEKRFTEEEMRRQLDCEKNTIDIYGFPTHFPYYPSTRWQGTLNIAEKLIKACNLSLDEFIIVSVEDLDCIS